MRTPPGFRTASERPRMTSAAACGEHGEIAVAPDVREALEIRGAVAAAVGIVPETDGHRREGRGADEFALQALQRPAVVVEDLDVHPEPAALQFAAIDGQRGIAECKAGHDVGAAGDRRELRCRRRSPRARSRTARAPAASPSTGSCAAARDRPGRRVGIRSSPARRGISGWCRRGRCQFLAGQTPQHALVRMERRAVEQHHGGCRLPGLASQFHIIQPHVVKKNSRSPTCTSECSTVFLQVLQQGAARAVDDALRHAGGARVNRGCRAGGRMAGARRQAGRLRGRTPRNDVHVGKGARSGCSTSGSPPRPRTSPQAGCARMPAMRSIESSVLPP